MKSNFYFSAKLGEQLYAAISEVPIIGTKTPDAKKLLDNNKKSEDEDIDEIYTELDIVRQPKIVPDLSSLIDGKIKKLFVFTRRTVL